MKATADLPTSLQMEYCLTLLQTPKATIAYVPSMLGCLSTYSAIKIQHLKHNRKLTLRVKIVFLKRNYLRQKIAITNLSCDYSRKDTLQLSDIIHSFEQHILVSTIRSCTLAYGL